MSTFVLVHGAWHGGWCFEHLASELRRRGHGTVAIDLPAGDVTAGNVAYAGVVAAALPDGDDIVLVGHSLAGLTIPLVAARRPVRSVVYLCALVPEPGRGIVDRLRDGEEIFVPGFSAAVVRDDQGRSFWPEREPAIHDLYHDCPRADAEAAFARLRPQARRPSTEACPLETLPWRRRRCPSSRPRTARSIPPGRASPLASGWRGGGRGAGRPLAVPGAAGRAGGRAGSE